MKEAIGYTEPGRGPGSAKIVISEWTYGPWNRYYYILTFKGSRLIRIESVRRK